MRGFFRGCVVPVVLIFLLAVVVGLAMFNPLQIIRSEGGLPGADHPPVQAPAIIQPGSNNTAPDQSQQAAPNNVAPNNNPAQAAPNNLPPANPQQGAPQAPADSETQLLRAVYQRVNPSVVSINVRIPTANLPP